MQITRYLLLCTLFLLPVAVPAQTSEQLQDQESIQAEIESRMMEYADNITQLSAVVDMHMRFSEAMPLTESYVQVLGDKIKRLDETLQSIDFRWSTFVQAMQMDIANSDELMAQMTKVQQMKQTLADTIAFKSLQCDALADFVKAEQLILDQDTVYGNLYKQACKLSLFAKLTPQLEKLKAKEQTRFSQIQQCYAKAQQAKELVPMLSKRMETLDDEYFSVQVLSKKIQETAYKPFLQRIKDYLISLACVAILLLFVNMAVTKFRAVKAARQQTKKYQDMLKQNGMGGNYPTISLLFPLLSLLFTSCDKLVAQFADTDHIELISQLRPRQQNTTQVHKVEFSPDYKTFVVTTRMAGDIGPYSLMDTSKVKILVNEKAEGIKKSRRSLPRLIGERNVKADNMTQSGIKMLALVDATLPQVTLNRIRDYITELRAVFNNDNLYVAFMQGRTVSQSMQATDYVLDTYFRKSSLDHVSLYRSILQKRDEMTSRQGPWADAKKTVLLTFSNEKVYDDDTDRPIDPDHYLLEEQLLASVPTPLDSCTFLASYASMKSPQEGLDSHQSAVLSQFCRNTRGIYMQTYSGTAFKDNILQVFQVNPDANEFTFENPDGKVYRGNAETLTVKFLDARTDSLITSFSTTISRGSIYAPIIVRGLSLPVIAAWGLLLGLVIALAVWLLLQIVVPYLRYRHFLSKYVVRYTGSDMGVGTTVVQESCYLCKAAFKTGDEIVVKCQHTMHRACWDENQYHCPEYSDRCKHGSHYYNRHNLTDPHNASFYMKWIIMAVVASWLAWLVFIMRQHYLAESFAAMLLPQQYISPLTTFGLSNGFFLTLGISLLVPRVSPLVHRSFPLASLLRSLAAAAGCYLVFLLFNILIVSSESDIVDVLIEWIPWTLSAIIIAFCGTYGTRAHLRKPLLLPSIAFGVLTMYVWWLFFETDVDYRVLLLLSFIIYSVGLAVSVATVSPRSTRYFLRVQGAVKPMDVALYKWFRNAPDWVVTLGKSVDCSLQLSWDLMGSVAPVHAEIRMKQDAPYLIALEEGVYVAGKSVSVGHRLWLRHGISFTIGNTTFTYVEKDIP